MAFTVADLIEAAFRKIGIVGPGMAASGDESKAALQTFNAMLHAWRLEGINYGAPTDPLADQMDYAETDNFPFPASFREGAIYCLASRIAPEYQLQGFDVEAFKQLMRTALVVIPTSSVDPALTWRNDRVRRFIL